MRSLLLLLVVALATHAAPIPPPKARPRPSPTGNWITVWSGSEWPTMLLDSGTYIAERPGGPRYEGYWSLQGDKLTIEERLFSPSGYGQVYRYTFTLRSNSLESTCGKLRFKRAD